MHTKTFSFNEKNSINKRNLINYLKTTPFLPHISWYITLNQIFTHCNEIFSRSAVQKEKHKSNKFNPLRPK